MLSSDIINSPLLIQSVVLLPDENILVVPISSSCNVKHKSSLVHQILPSELEVLIPNVFGFLPFQVSSSSLISDFQWNFLLVLWLNASSLRVEDEQLVVVTILAAGVSLFLFIGLGHWVCDISDNDVLSMKRKSSSRLQLCKDSERSIRNDSVLDGV